MRCNKKYIEQSIHLKMDEASSEMKYEEAALFRDQLKAIQNFNSKKSYANSVFEDRDIFALSSRDGIGVVVIIRIRNGFIYSREKISLKNLFYDEKVAYKTIITQFYLGSNLVPPLISLPIRPSGEKNIMKMLSHERNSKVRFEYPKIG